MWLLLSVQLAPCAVEGFYWYNGAIYYAGFFVLSLFYFGVMICYITMEARPFCGRLYIGLLIVLGILIGGGNYVTALLSLLVTVLAMVFAAVTHRKGWRWLLLPLVFLAVAFGISAFAPGNAVRQASCESTSAWYAIIHALAAGVSSIGSYLDVLHLIVFAALGGVFWKITERTEFSFPMPLLVGILSFGVYSAQYCPTLYAMNSIGPGRLQNIIYDMFLLLAMGNLFYVMGWIRRRLCNGKQKKEAKQLGYKWWRLAALGAMMLFCCLIPRDTPITAVAAVSSLRSGEAEQYRQEYVQRLAVLEDDGIPNAILPSYTVRPYLLYWGDASGTADYWANVALSRFYEKESVVIEYPE